jgi:Na+-driven multidrug efflux pump
MSLLAYSLFFIFSKEIINVFNSSNNLELTSIADVGIKVYYICLLFMGANMITTSILASKAKSGKSFMLSLCRAILFVVPLLYLLSKYFGIIGVWATIPVTEFITMLIFIF